MRNAADELAEAMTTTLNHPQPQQESTRRRRDLTAWSVDHRWLVLVLSTLALAVGVLAMSGLGIKTIASDEQNVGDSAKAEHLKADKDFGERPTEMVVATTREGTLTPKAAQQLGAELSAEYADVTGVTEVADPIPGADGRSVVVPVVLEGDAEDAADRVDPVSEVTEQLQTDHPELRIGQMGDGSIDQQVSDSFSKDFERAELFSIPLTMVILLIAFGAVIAAGVPLVLGLGSVGVALGSTALASHGLLAVDPNTQSLVLLIGLAVGVDYALFVLRRTREERRAGATSRDAILVAGRSAGRAVLISGLTVIAAMSGMLVAGGLFTSLALGTILVVAVAVLASATTLPALLAVLGDRVDSLRLPFTRRRAEREGSPDGLWGRLAGAVTRRPVLIGGTVALLLAGLALPALSMRTALGGIETLDQSLPAVQAYHQLEDAIPADGTSVQLVVAGPPEQADRIERTMLAAAARTDHDLTDVTGVAPTVTRSTDETVTLLNLGLAVTASDDRVDQVVADVRESLLPQVRDDLADVPGASAHLTGQAGATDMAEWMDGRLPWVVGFVLLLTLAVMAVSFGSPLLAVTTVLLNLLSVGAAYGVMTLVFSGGAVGDVAERLLDFQSTGAIASWLPLLMFVILFGLSMDYHVFVTSRVREAYDAGADPRSAVRLGVARSAGVVTSAAAVMVGVFSVFGTLSILEMKQLGVGLAAAIALDATLVRGVLLPASLTLLGDRAHRGPRWLPRLHH